MSVGGEWREGGSGSRNPGILFYFDKLPDRPSIPGIRPSASSTHCRAEQTDKNVKHTPRQALNDPGPALCLKSMGLQPLFPENRLTTAWCLGLG